MSRAVKSYVNFSHFLRVSGAWRRCQWPGRSRVHIRTHVARLVATTTLNYCDHVMTDPSKVSDVEWKKRLTQEEYHITREKGTEMAFTGKYHDFKGNGTYHCTCCGALLFDSDTKFDSGCGWPSFHTAVSENIKTATDKTHGMVRTEVMCSKCGAHQGHVFPDGPQPTGDRYCINSASIKFKPKNK